MKVLYQKKGWLGYTLDMKYNNIMVHTAFSMVIDKKKNSLLPSSVWSVKWEKLVFSMGFILVSYQTIPVITGHSNITIIAWY